MGSKIRVLELSVPPNPNKIYIFSIYFLYYSIILFDYRYYCEESVLFLSILSSFEVVHYMFNDIDNYKRSSNR